MDQEAYDNFMANSALKQQEIDGQRELYAPQIMEEKQKNQAVLVEQTNPKKVVDHIILRLRGMQEDPHTKKIVQVAEPKLNKKGIDAIWFLLDSYINQSGVLSHLKDAQISKLMNSLGDDLVDELKLNQIEYGIKRESDLDAINNSVLVNVFFALNRAREQNEKNWLGRVSIETINSRANEVGKSRGDSFLDKFKL